MDEPLDLSLKTYNTKQGLIVPYGTTGQPLENIAHKTDANEEENSKEDNFLTTLQNDNDISIGRSLIKQVTYIEEGAKDLQPSISNLNIPPTTDHVCLGVTVHSPGKKQDGIGQHEQFDSTVSKFNRDEVFYDGIDKNQDNSRIQQKSNPVSICNVPCPSSEKQSTDLDDASPIEMTVNGVTLSVVDSELWKTFKQIQNEMIINRGGRRMFPYIAVTFRGLRATALYDVILEIVSADQMRYKYVNDAWVPVGRAETFHTNAPFVHHECPCYGEDLMRKSLSFSRVKLTNSKEFAEGKMLLQSMCKYTMRISVMEREKRQRIYPFLLKETTFIAVTAYQNSKITNLKIQNNPFAKAFRKSRQKRQSVENPSSDDEEVVPSKTKLTLVPTTNPPAPNRLSNFDEEGPVSFPCSATLTQLPFYSGPSVLSMRDMAMYSSWFQGDYRMLAAALGYQSHLLAVQEMEGNKQART